MKRINGVLGLLCIIFITLSLNIAAVGPDISFEKTTVDFGTVQGGTILKYTFKYKNTGDQPLVITKLQAPCGCTAVQKTAGSVPPGEWGEIQAQINTQGFRNKIEKYIYVDTNVSHMPRITLVVNAVVIYDLDIVPSEFIPFYNVKSKQVVTKEVKIVNSTSNPITLSKPVIKGVDSKLFTVSVEELKKGMEYKVKVNFTAPEKSGNYGGEISIGTDNKNKPEINLPLSAYVMEDVYLTPKSIIISRKDPKMPRTRILSIMNGTKNDLKILGVELDSEFLTYKLDPIKGTSDYNLTVTVKNDAPKTVLRGEIKIKTDNPKVPILSAIYYISEE